MSRPRKHAASDTLLRGERAPRDTGAVVRPRQPWDMSAEERVAEMGELLALGYLRYRKKRLAHQAERERPCAGAVNTAKEKVVA